MLCPRCGNEKLTVIRKLPERDDADARIRLCESCGAIVHTTESITAVVPTLNGKTKEGK